MPGAIATNFGVRHILDAVIDLAPSPSPRRDIEGLPRHIDEGFSGFVFKDPDPRADGTALRHQVCRQRVRGRPGDHRRGLARRRSGLVNAADLRIGDSLYGDTPVTFPTIPRFAPELFVVARPRETGRTKQFRRGLTQLEQEGVVQEQIAAE
jgi:peptide chain release factor 3